MNDKELRPKVIKSFEALKGLPINLLPENQKHYYYFGKLATTAQHKVYQGKKKMIFIIRNLIILININLRLIKMKIKMMN